MKLKLAAVVVVMVSACTMNDGVALSAAQDMVQKQLKDPDSADFRNVRLAGMETTGEVHRGWICGEVNARNGFGGYTGFQRFAASIEYTGGGRISLSGLDFDNGDPVMFQQVHGAHCPG